MSSDPIHALQVAPDAGGPALTAPQKRFNTLIRQIDKARRTLAAWQSHSAEYRRMHGEVVRPLQAELLAGRRQWLFAVDALLDRPDWSDADRLTLREVLCEAAERLLERVDEDAEIKALFNKHADVDFDTAERERIQAMKDMAEAMTGLDLGDDDGLASDADLFERLRQTMQAEMAPQDTEGDAPAAAERPRTAAQRRREAEALQATQSVREVYRKLASALHPDREPDEARRAGKTALMQRVNQAYEANDLLALLELQLQIEQIDASHIANADAQRLKHYNKVLGEQLAELKEELQHVELGFRGEFRLEPGLGLDPRKLGPILEETSRLCRTELSRQQLQRRTLDNLAATRRWLKHERVRLDREAAHDAMRF